MGMNLGFARVKAVISGFNYYHISLNLALPFWGPEKMEKSFIIKWFALARL